MKSRWLIPIWALAVLATPILAMAGPVLTPGSATFSFYRITDNSSSNVASQFTLEVIDEGFNVGADANQVSFKFWNSVGTASSITDVYFHDGTLLGIASISSSAGVAFSDPATPSDLPGGESYGFVTTQNFSADANNPPVANGVNSDSDWLSIRFNLINGKTYADTLSALALGMAEGGVTGSLRVGMHVQGISPDGQSDGFLNTTVIVPTPTASLAGSGMIAALAVCRAISKRRAQV